MRSLSILKAWIRILKAWIRILKAWIRIFKAWIRILGGREGGYPITDSMCLLKNPIPIFKIAHPIPSD